MLLDIDAIRLDQADAARSIARLDKWLPALVDGINACLCSIDEGNLDERFVETLKATRVIAETVISTTVITNNLYAEYGDVAELTVDMLLTADKVSRYQKGDTSEINYISIRGQSMRMLTGKTQGETVQHKDRYERPMFWKDAEEKSMATEGVAPVLVYAYTELCKAEFSFVPDVESGSYMPKITLGAGTGTGDFGKAFLYKGLTGLHLDYISKLGALRRILLSDEGIVLSPYALERLDFYSNGFSMKYSGELVSYTWQKDAQGRIVSLTAEDGAFVPITWHAGGM